MKGEHEKHALVLGASSGLGKASAEKLASKGWKVWALYRERRAPHKLLVDQWKVAFGPQLVPINTNALSPEARAEVWETMRPAKGKLGLLLHSISRGTPGELWAPEQGKELSVNDFSLTWEAMALNWLEWSREALQLGFFAPEAANLAFTSLGSYRSLPGYAAIGMAKASLESLGRYMAAEFFTYGVRTNLIQAGITPTPALRVLPGMDQKLEEVRKLNPGQRLTSPEDVANVVYLLARQEAKWINGAIIPVDGGETII
jgi:enoyl-[acyl-carrier protein] reductase III